MEKEVSKGEKEQVREYKGGKTYSAGA